MVNKYKQFEQIPFRGVGVDRKLETGGKLLEGTWNWGGQAFKWTRKLKSAGDIKSRPFISGFIENFLSSMLQIQLFLTKNIHKNVGKGRLPLSFENGGMHPLPLVPTPLPLNLI